MTLNPYYNEKYEFFLFDKTHEPSLWPSSDIPFDPLMTHLPMRRPLRTEDNTDQIPLGTRNNSMD